jgi:hypothetical protein
MDDHHGEPSNALDGFTGLAIALIWLAVVAGIAYMLAMRAH